MAKAAGNSYSSPLSSPRRCSTLHILALCVAKQISAYSTYVPSAPEFEDLFVQGLFLAPHGSHAMKSSWFRI
jgi:hypothetical protein